MASVNRAAPDKGRTPADAGRLKAAVAGAERSLAVAFVREPDPAFQDVDHLKVQPMLMKAGRTPSRVRRISPDGTVTSIAGVPANNNFFNGGYIDGPGNFAQFSFPGGLVVGTTGALYVADTWNNRIRKIQ